MKKFELYFMRFLLIAVLATLAVSPFVAALHLLHGVASGTIEITHLLALGYLLLIAIGLFLISPVFGDSKPRHDRPRAPV